MNKIHSCTEARPAAACSVLSLPAAFRGARGMGWHGGGGLTLESFAGSRRGGSHRLTHLRLLPEIAAQRLAPLRYVTAVPPRRGALSVPPRHPPRRRSGTRTAPGDTHSGTHVPAPAHARHQPRHTRVTAPLAPGMGQACATHWGAHCSQEQGWGRGDRGRCTRTRAPWYSQPPLTPVQRWG